MNEDYPVAIYRIAPDWWHDAPDRPCGHVARHRIEEDRTAMICGWLYRLFRCAHCGRRWRYAENLKGGAE